jgi:hypothetical protein
MFYALQRLLNIVEFSRYKIARQLGNFILSDIDRTLNTTNPKAHGMIQYRPATCNTSENRVPQIQTTKQGIHQ